MKKALFLYSSTDGQTVKILNYIKERLSGQFECELVDLHSVGDIQWESYDRVLIGASIRYGHFHKALYKFIDKYQTALKNHSVAFFCVNLTARNPEKRIPENSTYMQKFAMKSPWQPKLQTVFAGALRYPRYGVFDRFMIKLIMTMTKGETDTTKEIEYTDWQQVAIFTDEFQRFN